MFLNVVPMVCIKIKLPNFGKFRNFVSVVKDLDKIFISVVCGLGCVGIILYPFAAKILLSFCRLFCFLQ
jgi:hypothetical protein